MLMMSDDGSLWSVSTCIHVTTACAWHLQQPTLQKNTPPKTPVGTLLICPGCALHASFSVVDRCMKNNINKAKCKAKQTKNNPRTQCESFPVVVVIGTSDPTLCVGTIGTTDPTLHVGTIGTTDPALRVGTIDTTDPTLCVGTISTTDPTMCVGTIGTTDPHCVLGLWVQLIKHCVLGLLVQLIKHSVWGLLVQLNTLCWDYWYK